jgi:hypothetical protein
LENDTAQPAGEEGRKSANASGLATPPKQFSAAGLTQGIIMTGTRNRRTTSVMAAAALVAMAGVANGDGLQAGSWKMTTAPEVNGNPAPTQVNMRCLTPADVADLDKTFSPETRTQNLTCERVEHEVSATALKWRFQCTGQLTMDVAGAFRFETPQRYSAEVTTKASIGGQMMNSRVKIDAERVGECP